MSQLPSMPVWISDFFSKTDHLSNEEQWAYLKLMMKTWVRNCKPLPDDDSDIARLLNMGVKRWRSVRPRIAPFFDLSEATWRQPHLENLFREASARNEKIVSAASLGGKAKAMKIKDISAADGSAAAMPTKTKDIDSDSPDGESAKPHDPIKALFDRGVRLLVGCGAKEPQARSLLGKWRRGYSDPEVLAAIVHCEDEAITEPVAHITRFLEHHHRGKNRNGQATFTAASERFICSRQDTLDAALQLKREREARERGTGGGRT